MIARSAIAEDEVVARVPSNVRDLSVLHGESLTERDIDEIFVAQKRNLTSQRGPNTAAAALEGGRPSAHLRPSSRAFRMFKYRNPATRRLKQFYICEHGECGKVFEKLHNFLDHLRTHTGERIFACRYAGVAGCPSKFTQKSNLNKHVATCHHRQRFARS